MFNLAVTIINTLQEKMVLIKEVVVIILFFILWTYSIYLFYRWFIIKGFISHFNHHSKHKQSAF